MSRHRKECVSLSRVIQSSSPSSSRRASLGIRRRRQGHGSAQGPGGLRSRQPMPGDKIRIGLLGRPRRATASRSSSNAAAPAWTAKARNLLVQLSRRCSRGPFHRPSRHPHSSRKRRTEFHSAAKRSHFHVALFTCAPRGASNGGPNMALRKARYIAEHEEPAEMELEGEIR